MSSLPNPMAFFKFESANVLADEMGGGDLTVVRGTIDPSRKVAGRVGGGLKFEHDDSDFCLYWDPPDASRLQDEFTISLWVQTEDSHSDYQALWASDPCCPACGTAYRFSVNDDRLGGSSMRSGCGGSGWTQLPKITIGDWIHVMLVYDGAANPKIRMIKDGVPFTEHNSWYHYVDFPITDDYGFYIGCTHRVNYNLDGILDELIVWDTAFTDPQIATTNTDGFSTTLTQSMLDAFTDVHYSVMDDCWSTVGASATCSAECAAQVASNGCSMSVAGMSWQGGKFPMMLFAALNHDPVAVACLVSACSLISESLFPSIAASANTLNLALLKSVFAYGV